MPKRPSLTPVFDKVKNRWKVELPPSLSTSGKRARSYFGTRKEARDFVEKIQGPDTVATIPPQLALEAEKAKELLQPWNIDLISAARQYAEARVILASTGGSIEDAARCFHDAWIARNTSCSFREAVSKYLDAREDLRAATLASYRYTLVGVFGPLNDQILADITATQINDLLQGKGTTAVLMHLRNLKVFWRWASRQPRGWAALSTIEAMEMPRRSSDADIEILKVKDVKALMRAAESEHPAAAVSYAIAIFGGVRMGELQKLTWANVLADHIEIGSSIAKKHKRRLIPICPTLRAWLDQYRNGAEDSDSIVPPNWTDVSKSVRRQAGWAVEARLLKNPPAPTRGQWPANACRHTCASVQVAVGTSLEDLIFKFGHSGGHDLLRAHYVARLQRKDALAILAIGPNGTKIPAIQEVA